MSRADALLIAVPLIILSIAVLAACFIAGDDLDEWVKK